MLVTALSVGAAWTPPDKPDAKEILDGAREDRQAGRYEDALQKHLWFHREALKHEPSMSGVRGSYAISDWATLAEQYPPAMQALLKERADAATDAAEGRNVFRAFSDVAAIDRELEDYRETYRVFLLIENRSEEQARRLYRSATEALVAMKDFPRASKYLDVDAEFRSLSDMSWHLKRQDQAASRPARDSVDRMVRTKAAQVVALLQLGGRGADAVKAAEKARAEFKDVPELEPLLVKALEGQLPPPLMSPEARAAWKKSRR